jgi:two-component system, OmpR family, response regulator RstA
MKEFLEKSGFQVFIESKEDRALHVIVKEKPYLVILDSIFLGRDDLSVFKKIRSRFEGCILILISRKDKVSIANLLETGADDYMIKPVDPPLLLAKVKALLRRGADERTTQTDAEVLLENRAAERQWINCGSMVVDASKRTLYVRKKSVFLTTGEFDLLWFLACRLGKVVTRDEIYRELRGIEYNGLNRSLDLGIARLRKKLGDDGRNPRRIKSIRSVGYLLAVD